MLFLASVLTQLLVAGILVLAGLLGSVVAYFYVQARRREASEAEQEAREIEQRDTELSHIRQRIEEIYERQQTGSETQFARVNQELEQLQMNLDAKGRQIDGVQGQLRYELKRHEEEIVELRNQLREAIEVFAAAALPAARPAAPALEAHPEPAAPAPLPTKSEKSAIYAPEPAAEPPAFAPLDDMLKDDHELLDDLFGGTDLDSEDALPEPDLPSAAEDQPKAEGVQPEVPAAPSPKRPFSSYAVVNFTDRTEPRGPSVAGDEVEVHDATPFQAEPVDSESPSAEASATGSDTDAPIDSDADLSPAPDLSNDEMTPARWADLDAPVAEAEAESGLEPPAREADPISSTPPEPTNEGDDKAAEPVGETDVFAVDDFAVVDPTAPDEDAGPDEDLRAETDEEAAPSALDETSPSGAVDFERWSGESFDPFAVDAEAKPDTPAPEPIPVHSGDGMSTPDFDADPFAGATTDHHPDPSTDLDSAAEPEAQSPVHTGDPYVFSADELLSLDPEPEPAATVPSDAEDLTLLSPVDEAMQQKLYALGITTIEAIARWSRNDARRVASELGHVSEEDLMDRWVFEAQSVLFERYQDELREQRESRLSPN